MGLFDASEKTPDPISRPAESGPVAASGGGAPPGVVSQAQATVERHRKRGRGRPSNADRAADGTGAPDLAAQQTVASAEIQKQLDALFAPENWRGIMRAPADLMLAFTGNELWALPKAEIDTLAATGSTAARYFMQTDPKWIALTLFLFSVATTYGTRATMHIKAIKQDE